MKRMQYTEKSLGFHTKNLCKCLLGHIILTKFAIEKYLVHEMALLEGPLSTLMIVLHNTLTEQSCSYLILIQSFMHSFECIFN